MNTYRPPQVGDLLAIRTADPYLPEAHAVIDRVADTGTYLLISGSWDGHDLEVVIRRVGQTANPQEN